MPQAPASSLAHDVLELLLADRAQLTDSHLNDLHARAVNGARLLLESASPYSPRVLSALLTAFPRDKERLSGGVTAGWGLLVEQVVTYLVLDETPLPPRLCEDLYRVVRTSRLALRDLLPRDVLEVVDHLDASLGNGETPPWEPARRDGRSG